MLLFRFSVVFLLRLAARRFLGLLFQERPRRTRRQGTVRASGVMAGSNQPPRKIAWRKRQATGAEPFQFRLATVHPGLNFTIEMGVPLSSLSPITSAMTPVMLMLSPRWTEPAAASL